MSKKIYNIMNKIIVSIGNEEYSFNVIIIMLNRKWFCLIFLNIKQKKVKYDNISDKE